MTTELKILSREGSKGFWGMIPAFCKGCGLCVEKCPKKCISWSSTLGVYGTPAVEANMDECIACGICQTVCPDCALTVVKKAKE